MRTFLFYPNNGNSSLTAEEKATLLKESLSQSLAMYYPFAGGVLFLEARNDGQLDTFQSKSWDDKTLDQLFVNDLVLYKNTSGTIPVAVQLNHFSGGGLAFVVSLSHTIADGCTLGSFLSHWASVARYGSTDHKEVLPLNPHFINSPRTQPTLPKARVKMEVSNNFVLKNFVFPNSKLSDLKNKVVGSIINPTRVEVLTSLVYTTVVAAATTKSGCFKPSYLFFVVNVRDKFVPKLPQSTVGNCAKAMMVETRDISETSLSNVVGEIRKKKSQLESIQSVQQLVEETKSLMGKLVNGGLENVGKGSYWCSSFCGFPFNKLYIYIYIYIYGAH
ncbi:putative deacetylvindoline O-acetyltransferase [Helianthus anomalus]